MHPRCAFRGGVTCFQKVIIKSPMCVAVPVVNGGERGGIGSHPLSPVVDVAWVPTPWSCTTWYPSLPNTGSETSFLVNWRAVLAIDSRVLPAVNSRAAARFPQARGAPRLPARVPCGGASQGAGECEEEEGEDGAVRGEAAEAPQGAPRGEVSRSLTRSLLLQLAPPEFCFSPCHHTASSCHHTSSPCHGMSAIDTSTVPVPWRPVVHRVPMCAAFLTGRSFFKEHER